MCAGLTQQKFGELRRYTVSPAPNWGVLSGRVLTHSWTRCGTPYRYVMKRNAKTAVTISSPSRFYRRFKKAKRDVFKGDKAAIFHTSSHMAATRLFNDAMVKTNLIGDLLGHASERTTNRYIHAKKSSLIETLNMV